MWQHSISLSLLVFQEFLIRYVFHQNSLYRHVNVFCIPLHLQKIKYFAINRQIYIPPALIDPKYFHEWLADGVLQKRTLSGSTLRLEGIKRSTHLHYTIFLLEILCLLFLFDLYYLIYSFKTPTQYVHFHEMRKHESFPKCKNF